MKLYSIAYHRSFPGSSFELLVEADNKEEAFSRSPFDNSNYNSVSIAERKSIEME